MSKLAAAIEAEFGKARASLGEVIEFFTGKAEDALKSKVAELEADEIKMAGDVKDVLGKAKATALADVQANSPEASALVSKYITELEAAVVAAIEGHLVP